MAEDIPSRVAARLLANRTLHLSLPYYEVDAASGCWMWLRERDRDGYGHLTWFAGGTNRRGVAHRVMYVMLVGSIPDGLVLDHVVCDTPSCVNPAHVAPVTNRQNIARSPRFPGNRTHCPQGHPYNEANTRIRPTGARQCKECNRQQARVHMAARRAAAREAKALGV